MCPPDRERVASLGWENKFDVTPTDLWSMHKNVGAKGSSVIEKDPGTHVWNYTMENISTKPLKKAELPSYLRDNASKPGMMKGTTDDAGKHFFKTEINGEEYHYWAKFDAQGNLYFSDGSAKVYWLDSTFKQEKELMRTLDGTGVEDVFVVRSDS